MRTRTSVTANKALMNSERYWIIATRHAFAAACVVAYVWLTEYVSIQGMVCIRVYIDLPDVYTFVRHAYLHTSWRHGYHDQMRYKTPIDCESAETVCQVSQRYQVGKYNRYQFVRKTIFMVYIKIIPLNFQKEILLYIYDKIYLRDVKRSDVETANSYLCSRLERYASTL